MSDLKSDADLLHLALTHEGDEFAARVVNDLQTQLAAMTAERDEWRELYESCAEMHSNALAKVALLRYALTGIEQFFVRSGEDINKKFERIGQAFYKATGMLRPGKDASMYCPHTYEEREKAFDEWCAAKAVAARNALEQTQ